MTRVCQPLDVSWTPKNKCASMRLLVSHRLKLVMIVPLCLDAASKVASERAAWAWYAENKVRQRTSETQMCFLLVTLTKFSTSVRYISPGSFSIQFFHSLSTVQSPTQLQEPTLRHRPSKPCLEDSLSSH